MIPIWAYAPEEHAMRIQENTGIFIVGIFIVALFDRNILNLKMFTLIYSKYSIAPRSMKESPDFR